MNNIIIILLKRHIRNIVYILNAYITLKIHMAIKIYFSIKIYLYVDLLRSYSKIT